MPDTTIYGIVSGLSIPVPGAGPGRGRGAARRARADRRGAGPPSGDQAAPRFRRGISAFPALGDAVLAVTQDDLACVYAPPASSTVRIGTVHLEPLPAGADLARRSARQALRDPRHHRLRQVLRGDADPAAGSSRATPTRTCWCSIRTTSMRRAFAGTAEVLGPDSLQLPYWLLNSEEIASVILGTNPHSHGRRRGDRDPQRADPDRQERCCSASATAAAHHGRHALALPADRPQPAARRRDGAPRQAREPRPPIAGSRAASRC